MSLRNLLAVALVACLVGLVGLHYVAHEAAWNTDERWVALGLLGGALFLLDPADVKDFVLALARLRLGRGDADKSAAPQAPAASRDAVE